MPTSSTILEQLAAATNQLTWLAIAWHIAILAIAVVLGQGWRSARRQAALLLVTPALSVGVVATVYGAWFNAVSFGVLALVLLLMTGALEQRWRVRGPLWSKYLGIAMIAYGFCYPHFVDGAWYRSLYAAPVGVVPCPTLAVIIGFTLLSRGSRSRAIPTALAAWAAFYALFGIVILGVVLDLGLLVGAIGVAVLAVKNRRASKRLAGTFQHSRRMGDPRHLAV